MSPYRRTARDLVNSEKRSLHEECVTTDAEQKGGKVVPAGIEPASKV